LNGVPGKPEFEVKMPPQLEPPSTFPEVFPAGQRQVPDSRDVHEMQGVEVRGPYSVFQVRGEVYGDDARTAVRK